MVLPDREECKKGKFLILIVTLETLLSSMAQTETNTSDATGAKDNRENLS